MHPSDILVSVRSQHNADATEKEIFESFLGRLMHDDHAIREVAYSWFKPQFKRSELVPVSANEYEVRPVPTRSGQGDSVSAPVSRPRPPNVSPEQRERETKIIAEWKEKSRAALTMTQVMPNGEQLQHCDAGYVRKLGGVFTALVKGLPDNVRVGPHRTNDQLQAVCKRYKLEAAA